MHQQKKIVGLFFLKKISTAHLTNYIDINGLWNHANNLNHSYYNWNSITILFNHVHRINRIVNPHVEKIATLVHPGYSSNNRPYLRSVTKLACPNDLILGGIPQWILWLLSICTDTKHECPKIYYSLDTMNGLGTRMSTRKLIHTLKLTSHYEWKELSYPKVNFFVK
jgi:hypothetical protein